ncbi:hypothetical protein SAMN04487947_0977 [Halogeometricum rufum]|uniref:Uncharacterized protein n=1 Tax=Halogeometricum rufum TaxID=553469 RepID=A0A1I6GDQ3_9EURY|nr:hypothetical protein [Halogeometricum rufum]SFR40325.1 hypothetical protein SAMN04487947_0977 [Halogeometricum rufum]
MKTESTGNDDILELLSRRDEVADDVERRGEVVVDRTETAELTRHRRVHVVESESSETLPRSTYESERRRRTLRPNRWEHAPSKFRSMDIDYVTDESPDECSGCGGAGRTPCPTCDGSAEETCPDCDATGVVDCEGCGGAGRNDCSTCHGSGTVTERVDRPCGQCDGNTSIRCPSCLGDDDDCLKCTGDGVVSCPRCRGRGTETEARDRRCGNCEGTGWRTCGDCGGEKTQRCGRCEGGGHITCRECSGAGDVECERCEGDGETVTATLGTMAFSSSKEFEVDAAHVPESRFKKTDGDGVSTTCPVDGDRPPAENWSGTHLYRHETSRSNADCQHLVYAYDDDRYTASLVDGELRYDDFPNDPDHLDEMISSALNRGYFDLLSPTDDPDGVAAAFRRAVGDAVKFLLVSALAFGALFAATTLAGADLFTAVGVVVLALVAVAVAAILVGDRDYSGHGTDRSSPVCSPLDFAPSALAGLGAALTFVLDVGSVQDRWLVVAFAVGLWAAHGRRWLDFEARRLAFRSARRAALLDRLTTDEETLSKFALGDRLPPANPTPGAWFYDRSSTAVFTVGWMGSAVCFAAALVAGGDGGTATGAANGVLSLLAVLAVAVAVALSTVLLGESDD